MNPCLTRRALPAVLLAAFSGGAGAGGFQLLEQNASGLGNAFAGSAAVAENASTIFFNPAGMTQLKEREVSLGVSAIKTSYKFKDAGSSVGGLAGTGDGNDGGGWGYVPNAHLSWALGKDLYLGLGVGAPFGLKTEYDSPWVGAAQSIMFDIKTVNLNPSLAYRLNDQVSLGAGVSYQKIDVEYQRLAAVLPVFPVGPGAIDLTQHRATLTADDTGWGWNLGALFSLDAATKLGVSYRSKVKYSLEGNIAVTGGASALDAAFNASQSSPVKADLELPDTAIVSVAQKLDDHWDMLGDLSWTGWSSIEQLKIVNANSGATVQTIDAHFRDTWRVALGANYKLSEASKLKFGIAYDQTPVQDAAHRLTALPDNNRVWFSVGGQWKPAPTSAVDVGVAYLRVKDAPIDNDQAPLRGRVTGTYEDKAFILGAQYSQAF